MAKRKAPAGRKASAGKTARRASGGRTAASARKAKGARKAARKTSKKTAARKAGVKRAGTRTSAAAKGARKKARKTAAPRRTTAARKGATARKAARSAPAGRKRTLVVPARKAPSLDRQRRVVTPDEDIVQETPPSSLDLDRSASAVRSGRRSLRDRYQEHTETSPALTGGDVDADWESAYSVGDEAPGGDNPTPDQDIVDDIGRAVGIEYQDNEELKGADKVERRDRKRWELDPASSEDWDER
jgi:hypothetical protein